MERMDRPELIKAFVEETFALVEQGKVTREKFQDLFVRGCLLMHVEDKEISEMFGASRSTIKRWKSGINAPLPTSAVHVLAWLCGLAISGRGSELCSVAPGHSTHKDINKCPVHGKQPTSK